MQFLSSALASCPPYDPASVVSRSCLSCVTILPQLCHDPASVVSRSCPILTQLCHDPASVGPQSCLSWATICLIRVNPSRLCKVSQKEHHVHNIIQNRNSFSVESDCDLSGIGLRSQWNRTTTSVPSKLKCGCTHFPDQYVVEERKIQKTFEFIWWNHRKVVPLHPQFRNRGHTVLTMIVQNAPLAQLVEQLTLNQWV